MRKLVGGAAILTGLAALAVAATAVATPNLNFNTEQLSFGNFGRINVKTNETPGHQVKLWTKGDSDVYVVRNTVLPGGHSGWHTHPGPSLITVMAGTATFYDGDDRKCRPQVYPAGTGVIDPGDGHVHILRNEGSDNLVTVTVQILPDGASRRIDAPQPGNCPF